MIGGREMKIKSKLILMIIIIMIVITSIPQQSLAWDGDGYYRGKLKEIGVDSRHCL